MSKNGHKFIINAYECEYSIINKDKILLNNVFIATFQGGATDVEGSTGYTFKTTKEVIPIHKKVHTEINVDAANEVVPAAEIEKEVIHETVEPVVVKEVSNVWRPNFEIQGKLNFQFNFDKLINTAFAAAGYYLQPWYVPLQSYIYSQVCFEVLLRCTNGFETALKLTSK